MLRYGFQTGRLEHYALTTLSLLTGGSEGARPDAG